MNGSHTITVPLQVGKTTTLLNQAPSGSGTSEVRIPLDCEAVLISLFATAISGTLDCSVYTDTDTGKTKLIQQFPQISAPTSELVLKKAASVMGVLRVVVTYTGACSFEIRAKGIGAGETTVKLVGASNWETSQETVGTSPVQIVLASVNDRQGVVIKNWSTTTDVYVAESQAACLTASCWPLAPRDSLALDVNAGATVWARTASGSADVRLSIAGE